MTMAVRVALAEKLIATAGAIILRSYHDPATAVVSKSPGDVVSDADFAVENFLRDEIGSVFPDDTIVGEEFGGGAADAGCSWLIDPVDGTVNFARKLGYFCVSLALLSEGRPIGAWIYDPLQDELFHAGPDGIARLNGTPVVASAQTDIREAVIGLGFSPRHDGCLPADVIEAVVATGAEFRRLGAGALCLAHVAAGRLEGYLEPHMNPWDAVGGLYLAACAGAVTGDYVGAGGLLAGGAVYAVARPTSDQLLARLPAPFSGTPLHRENEQRSAGKVAT